MGRVFLEFVPAAAAPRYVCAGCGVDVACEAQLLWEGFMNVSTPAFLFKAAVNTQGASPPRQELLSTGRYKLHDVSCRGCSALLGWQYLWAERQDQQYKTGAFLLDQATLLRLNTKPRLQEAAERAAAAGASQLLAE